MYMPIGSLSVNSSTYSGGKRIWQIVVSKSSCRKYSTRSSAWMNYLRKTILYAANSPTCVLVTVFFLKFVVDGLPSIQKTFSPLLKESHLYRTFLLLNKPPLVYPLPTLQIAQSRPLSACPSPQLPWGTFPKLLVLIAMRLSRGHLPLSILKWKQPNCLIRPSLKKCSSMSLLPPQPARYPLGEVHRRANCPLST